MDARIFFQIRLRQLEQRGGWTQPVFLQMHECARQLDEALVKISVRAVAVGQPQILEHIVRLVKKLAVEAVEIAEVMRVQFLSPEGFDHRGDAGAFVTHRFRIKSKARSPKVKVTASSKPHRRQKTARWLNANVFVSFCALMNVFVNQRVKYALSELGQIAFLAKDICLSLLTFKVVWRDLLYQLYSIGVKSQSVVIITGAFTGMVLGAQTYFQFHKVKMDTATLAVVSVSLCDELGPVLTALMVAGRVGASIAAEIGTMRVTEQIDALRTLATHPVDYLVVPRIVAAHIALPLLAMEAIVVGIGGSYLVCVLVLGIEPVYLWENMLKYTEVVDLVIGLVKAFIFGGIIALIGSYKGLTCGLGAEGVGLATTEAVVYSSITILVTNFFLTLVMGKIVGLI